MVMQEQDNITIRMPVELKEKLKAVAKSKGLNASNYIRMVVIEAINKEEAKE